MNFRFHKRHSIGLDSLFMKDGEVFTVTGFADQPVIFLRSVSTGEERALVIRSPLFEEYVRYEPADGGREP